MRTLRNKKVMYWVLCWAVLVVSVITTPMNIKAITNTKQPTTITFTKKKTTIIAGQTYTYKVNVEGSTSSVTWSVSNKKVATISSSGKLSAKRAGQVTVTAKVGTMKSSIKVKVKGKQLIAIDPGHQSKGNSSTETIGPGAKTKKAKVASDIGRAHV